MQVNRHGKRNCTRLVWSEFKNKMPISHDKCVSSDINIMLRSAVIRWEKVQVGNDQEKAQSERDSHSKSQGGKNYIENQVLTMYF